MIVYVKSQSGNVYASPVFAEIKKGQRLESVILNEQGDGLILLPCIKEGRNLSDFNYYYIDETEQDGWIEADGISGFAEIVDNEQIIYDLKRGKYVSTEGLNCVRSYSLPLPVITEFEIKTQEDISTFHTVCWGLHDARIDEIDEHDDDLTINFDTTWGKHIIVTYHSVIEKRRLDILQCILDSDFEIGSDCIKWSVTGGFDLLWNGINDDVVYIIARSITWKLVID